MFSFLPIQLNTFQKGFSSYFLSKVFHLLYFTSKQTHHLVVNFDRGTNSRCYINGSHIICNLCKYYIVGPFVASCWEIRTKLSKKRSNWSRIKNTKWLWQISNISSYTLEESRERILAKTTHNPDKRVSSCWKYKFLVKDQIWYQSFFFFLIHDTRVCFLWKYKIFQLELIEVSSTYFERVY